MKPDRFEFVPDRAGIKQEDDAYLHKAIVGLLRRNHQAYVRIVKRRKVNLGRFIDKDLLLDALARYRKGTR